MSGEGGSERDADDFARGAALFDAGACWEAHEAWERVWREERLAWLQGLVQVAAAFYKLFEKRDVAAARRILGRALAKLGEGEDEDEGVVTRDTRVPGASFVAAVKRCAEALDRADAGDEATFDRALVPRLGAASPAAARRLVVVGRTATASPDFSLEDLPSTSGRLDVLVRCVRAALLVSHGVRRDTLLYLVLLGGHDAPRALRIDGATVRFLRPDERSLATLVRKSLAAAAVACGAGGAFAEVRPGIAVAAGGLDAVLADLGAMHAYVLDERAPDLRDARIAERDAVFFIGDHLGFDDATRSRLAALGAVPVSVGPVSLHADDAVAVLANELDRRAAR